MAQFIQFSTGLLVDAKNIRNQRRAASFAPSFQQMPSGLGQPEEVVETQEALQPDAPAPKTTRGKKAVDPTPVDPTPPVNPAPIVTPEVVPDVPVIATTADLPVDPVPAQEAAPEPAKEEAQEPAPEAADVADKAE